MSCTELRHGGSGKVGSPVANLHSPGWPLEGACSLSLCGSLQFFSCLSLSLCLSIFFPTTNKHLAESCGSGTQGMSPSFYLKRASTRILVTPLPPTRGARLRSGSSHIHNRVCYVGSCHSRRRVFPLLPGACHMAVQVSPLAPGPLLVSVRQSLAATFLNNSEERRRKSGWKSNGKFQPWSINRNPMQNPRARVPLS